MGGDDDASIVGAVEIGATAHVASTVEPAELVATIRRVAEGEDPLKDELIGRPDLIERIIDGIRESIEAQPPSTHPLTPRELEVLTHVAAGSRNCEIADALGVSEQTVNNHLSSILHKLGVPNRTRAVTYAARQGWLDLDDLPKRAGQGMNGRGGGSDREALEDYVRCRSGRSRPLRRPPRSPIWVQKRAQVPPSDTA